MIWVRSNRFIYGTHKTMPPSANALLVFTPMSLADVDHIDELERVCFRAPWSAATYRRELQHNRLSSYWVIRPANRDALAILPPILAYGGFWLMSNEAHIATIATHPQWRRRKLSEWLLLEMIAQARIHGAYTATLEVRVSNLAAQALYEKLGFVEVGQRKRYYRDNGEDARLMTLFNLDDGAVWRPLAQQLTFVQEACLSAFGPHYTENAEVTR
jgi:ribosomal-protein-alanine N-acetyltransferase